MTLDLNHMHYVCPPLPEGVEIRANRYHAVLIVDQLVLTVGTIDALLAALTEAKRQLAESDTPPLP